MLDNLNSTKLISVEQTIFVVEDDVNVAETLRWLLNSLATNFVIYQNAENFLEAFEREQQGCLLLDVRLSGMSGLRLQDYLAQHKINLPIIFITGHGDIDMATRAMKNGAFDFLTKPFNNQFLLDRIQDALLLNQQQYQRAYLSNLMHKRLDLLTQREKQVMQAVVSGKINKAIANELGISAHTVELHRTKVMRKLQVHSLAELIRLALEHELVE